MSELYKAYAAEGELAELIFSTAQHWAQKAERDRFDLFPFFCILTSTGWNKNTDIFDPHELWDARKSPIDKPVNAGHVATKIYGHIVDCITVGEDLKPIPEDTDKADLPYKLHVVLACVLYRYFDDAKAQAEVNELIDKISKGNTFVSMECLFKNFDFGLMDAKGEQKRIPRNDKTAGLTKFLRQYRGPGTLHGYTIGRILRDITFSAVGIVDKPACADAIISDSLNIFNTANASNEIIPKECVYINLDISRSGDNLQMSKEATVETAKAVEDDPKYKELLSNHESLVKAHELMRKDNDFMHTRISELKSELELTMAKVSDDKKEKDDKVKADDAGESQDEAMAALRAEVASLKEKLTVAETTKASLETAKASLDTEKAELVKANDALNATVEAFRKASRHSDRAEALMAADATLTREKALEKVSAMDEMADTTFASMCEMIKGYASRAPKEVTPESILAGAKAEASPPLGASPENAFEKTSADIKKFLCGKTTKGE